MQLFNSRVRKKCALTIHLIDLQTLNNEPQIKKRRERKKRKRISSENKYNNTQKTKVAYPITFKWKSNIGLLCFVYCKCAQKINQHDINNTVIIYVCCKLFSSSFFRTKEDLKTKLSRF